jgi:hypothetical protein
MHGSFELDMVVGRAPLLGLEIISGAVKGST